MDALLTTFIAAGLAEFGDKTQLLVIALAARYAKALPILAGVAIAALANNIIAVLGATLITGLITIRAVSLLVALALVFAGVAGLFRQKSPEGMGSTWKTGPFLTAAGCFFLLEFGDKTQFVTFALAAQFNAFALAAAGATAGVIAASIPAAVLGKRAPVLLRLSRARALIALIFLPAGVVVGLNALRLV